MANAWQLEQVRSVEAGSLLAAPLGRSVRNATSAGSQILHGVLLRQLRGPQMNAYSVLVGLFRSYTGSGPSKQKQPLPLQPRTAADERPPSSEQLSVVDGLRQREPHRVVSAAD